MAASRDPCKYFEVVLGFLLISLRGLNSQLQAYGCDEGWTNFQDHCYVAMVAEVKASVSRSVCESEGAHVTSVWTPEEKTFILSLWRFPDTELGFLWIGLRGVDGSWAFDDNSAVTTKVNDLWWSVFTGVPGVPASINDKCVAFRNSGSLAFLDCELLANAFVCKKALPKVYATSSLLNHSSPHAVHPLSHVKMFERMLPPILTTLPEDSSRLGQVEVSTEVSCAYKCFSVSACQVFQVSCVLSDKCQSFKCVLFSGLVSR